MDQDIDQDEADAGEAPAGAGAVEAAAAAAAAGALCLSCGAAIVGPFCARCGQKNDDLRRSSLILGKEFLKDTFGFDSRMWRTLGLLAVAPGRVPTDYSHGRRSRYSPPVRLFLVVSFLFFLTLAATNTLFVAMEVTRKTPEEVAAEAAARERVAEFVILDSAPEGLPECAINVRLRFFVRPQDAPVDIEAWRACAESLRAASLENTIEVGGPGAADSEDMRRVMGAFDRVLGGLTGAAENPRAFNREVNEWLPRVMFLMTPVLALLIGLFIRRGALLFDHLVLSLYSHAAGFAVVGAAVIATQLGAPHAGLAATALLAVYFVVAMKRAYRRGWIKTLLASAFIATFYFVILCSAVMWIVSNAVWTGV